MRPPATRVPWASTTDLARSQVKSLRESPDAGTAGSKPGPLGAFTPQGEFGTFETLSP